MHYDRGYNPEHDPDEFEEEDEEFADEVDEDEFEDEDDEVDGDY